jgi:uncharacterized membrane protein/thiol-disulfide isomerase/thioredoxin
MRNKKTLSLLCLGWLILLSNFLLQPARTAWADEPVVRAVLFYSPTCPHCQKVIQEDLLPLIDKYGKQLEIIGVNIESEGGQALFLAAIQKYGLESYDVPTLVIGDHVLVGSVDIPEQFPGLVEQYLAQGGVDWPDIPGLAEAIGAAQVTPTSDRKSPTDMPLSPTVSPTDEPVASMTTEPLPTNSGSGSPATGSRFVIGDEPTSLTDRLAHDPAGNALAIIVLLGMIVTAGRTAVVFPRLAPAPLPAWRDWAIPVLSLIGCGVAAYMAYVETTQVSAVCGPVGDCNTVQQSAYARLFGVLPIGVLGVLGYIAILVAWLVRRFGRGCPADLAALALLGMTAFGTLFSIYLTFLEPFVIGATCAWCLSSAIIMTLLLWLALPSGRQAIINLYQGDSHA